MALELASQDLLVQRILNTDRGVFLVGSALVYPEGDGPGVPGVDGVVALVREAYGGNSAAQKGFDDALARDRANRYQTAFNHLLATHGPDAVERVIRNAVLQARQPGADSHSSASESVDREGCVELEEDGDGWFLPPAAEKLGQIVATLPGRFGRFLLTTNFDPLVKVAIRRAGGQCFKFMLHSDSGLEPVAGSGCRVVHLHGDWCRTDTLHSPAQLTVPRPQLESSLRRLLQKHTLIVLGYGGWDNVLTRALGKVVSDSGETFEIVWAFHDSEPRRIEEKYPTLLELLGPGLGRGRVQLYGGVSIGPLLREVWKGLAPFEAQQPREKKNQRKGPTNRLPADEDLLKALVDPDPLICMPVAQALTERPDLLGQVVQSQSSKLVSQAAVRSVMCAHARESAPLLVASIEQAGTRWHSAVAAAAYLGPAHEPYCADQLARLLDAGDVDVVRLAIESLGRVGAWQWGFKFEELFPQRNDFTAAQDYHFKKHHGYVLDALARMFAAAEESTSISNASFHLLRLLEDLETRAVRQTWGLSQRLILRASHGAQIDRLFSDWLGHRLAQIQIIAVEALEDGRVTRSVPRLIELLRTAEDGRLRQAVALALGVIATPAAVSALLEHTPTPESGWGISFCLSKVQDDTRRRDLMSTYLEGSADFRWAAVRAIGLRQETSFAEKLRDLLHGPRPLERGAAALALARLQRGADDRALVHGALREASDPLERVLCALAIITLSADSYPEIEHGLRHELAHHHPYLYMPPLQEDILSTLLATARSDAKALAAAWQPFFGPMA